MGVLSLIYLFFFFRGAERPPEEKKGGGGRQGDKAYICKKWQKQGCQQAVCKNRGHKKPEKGCMPKRGVEKAANYLYVKKGDVDKTGKKPLKKKGYRFKN